MKSLHLSLFKCSILNFKLLLNRKWIPKFNYHRVDVVLLFMGDILVSICVSKCGVTWLDKQKLNLLNKQLAVETILWKEHAIRSTFTRTNHHHWILLSI